MTDREQDQAEALAERERTPTEGTEDIERRPVGEEFDPDALRPLPQVDEEGNIIEDDLIDDVYPDE